jgi:negative regulator of sigma-B (phosphoserine phosphatase)
MMTARLAEWGTAGRALSGEPESGDLSVAVEYEEGLLLAVIDGLGHGPEARQAAEMAADVIRDRPERPLDWLLRECHEVQRHARGVVMALASIRPEGSAWIGVGNIEGKLIRPGVEPLSPISLPQLGGIIGYQLPPLHVSPLRISPDDVLVLATDGLQPDFRTDVRSTRPVQEIADSLLETFGKTNDDAMVLVARYLGEG